MKDFIIEILNVIGLGVHGNISNIDSYKVNLFFPNCLFVKMKQDKPSKTTVQISNTNTGSYFFIEYTHKENGMITDVKIL